MILGVSIFVWIMNTLIHNQVSSVAAIDEETRTRRGKIKEQPADISTNLSPRFSDLEVRIKRQYSVLRGLQIAVALVWISTVVIVIYTQGSDLRPQLVVLVSKAVNTAAAWLVDACTWLRKF